MNKRGQVWDSIIPWIIGAIVLVLVVILYFVLRDKGLSAIEFLKGLVKIK